MFSDFERFFINQLIIPKIDIGLMSVFIDIEDS